MVIRMINVRVGIIFLFMAINFIEISYNISSAFNPPDNFDYFLGDD